MKIKYGLISCDSHGQLGKEAFTSRMSKAKWGDQIPHIIEIKDKAFDYPVERWVINGKVQGDSVCNCPIAMDDPQQRYYPQRWDEVPPKVYDPISRLEALDLDGIDGEVLFPNGPVPTGTFFQGDADFELACVQAYNDALAAYRQASDRYIPLAIIPYLSPIESVVAEVERAVKNGHRGINMLAEPSLNRKGLKHFNDAYWDPLWTLCQDIEVPVHWHGSAGLAGQLSLPRWQGFTRSQFHTVSTLRNFATPAQLIPNLIFSGMLDRYPRLKWVCAETGLGWVSSILEGSDHEWERCHLWTEGILTRPSELFHRQIYVDFWFETMGIELRHTIGVDNIMWESDYPHVTSTYPQSWKFVERTLAGVAQEERQKILYGNAVRLYQLT